MSNAALEWLQSQISQHQVPFALAAGCVIGVSGYATFAKSRVGRQNTRSTSTKWQKDLAREYCYTHTNITDSVPLRELRHVTSEHSWAVMESTPDVGQFLVFLARTIRPKNIIEVGSFTGVALLRMAQELPNDGKIFALDTSADYTDIGKPFMEKAGVLQKVDYRIAPAIESLIEMRNQGYEGKIDMCFIDADKHNYPNYYKLCMDLLKPGGIIVFDNSLYGNRLLDDKISEPNCYIHEVNEKAMEDERVTSLLLHIGDGCLVLRKHDQ